GRVAAGGDQVAAGDDPDGDAQAALDVHVVADPADAVGEFRDAGVGVLDEGARQVGPEGRAAGDVEDVQLEVAEGVVGPAHAEPRGRGHQGPAGRVVLDGRAAGVDDVHPRLAAEVPEGMDHPDAGGRQHGPGAVAVVADQGAVLEDGELHEVAR